MRRDDGIVESRLHGVAAIVAAIPRSLWNTLIVLLISFTITAIATHLNAIPQLVNSVLYWIGIGLDVSLGLVTLRIIIGIIHNYHMVMLQGVERRQAKERLINMQLKNDLLCTKIREREYIPLLVKSALEQGQNVEMEGLKVSNYLSNLHTIMPGGVNGLNMPTVQLSGKCEMISVARRHDFTKDNIFLAIGKGEQDLVTSVESYVHCANDGSTGTGKTANGRGQLTQFIKAGVDCYLVNPHFSSVTKKGEDWRSIAFHLFAQPTIDNGLPRVLTQFPNIGACLEWTANVEIDRRFAMMREGNFGYRPLYLYIDEWPAIVTNCKDAPVHLRTILQRGRAVEVCVFVNSQGFLQNDTDLKGSARENFDTTFFLGGSIYSGAKLLDLSEKNLRDQISQLNEPLGKGVAFMRNNSVMSEASPVRLPMVTNEFVHYVLGHHDDYVLPDEVILVRTEGDSDHDKVRWARDQLLERGDHPTARAIAEMTTFGKTKVAQLLKEIE